MNNVFLTRAYSSVDGTLGQVRIGADPKLFCYSIELPWRDNMPTESCIPTGVYTCEVVKSPRFKRELYEVKNVPGRSNILIHVGNIAGDIHRGRGTDSQGCILLGMRRSTIRAQDAVLDSRLAVQKFMDTLQNKEFMLHIINQG